MQLSNKKDKGEEGWQNQVVVKLRNIIWWNRPLKQMPFDIVKDANGLPRVILTEPGGSSAEVLPHGGRIASWKNERGEEMLFLNQKANGKSPVSRIKGGISLCSPLLGNPRPDEEQSSERGTLWSIDNDILHQCPITNGSSVNLILKSYRKGLLLSPYSFELRLHVSLSPGKLTLIFSIKNTDKKSFTFKFAVRNFLSVSDISEVRVEGLETVDYLDNLLQRQRFTEPADAMTFDNEIHRVYLSTPPRIAVIDHDKKRTIVLHKAGLPDAVIWNPWGKKSKLLPFQCDKDYKVMLSVDSAAYEKPIVLKPSEEWKASQELSIVSSSYCSGQLDSKMVMGALANYNKITKN
ncbi:hypothetical protein LIER_30553 [Lithospermum erythrorhizon]|uniref:glucose-6-phosphate 1-epimerase n=1 Tax=Lithospermum erythrorhizon TaxID=34254 RepID=A0AAV3RPZ1_LITER